MSDSFLPESYDDADKTAAKPKRRDPALVAAEFELRDQFEAFKASRFLTGPIAELIESKIESAQQALVDGTDKPEVARERLRIMEDIADGRLFRTAFTRSRDRLRRKFKREKRRDDLPAEAAAWESDPGDDEGGSGEQNDG